MITGTGIEIEKWIPWLAILSPLAIGVVNSLMTWIRQLFDRSKLAIDVAGRVRRGDAVSQFELTEAFGHLLALPTLEEVRALLHYVQHRSVARLRRTADWLVIPVEQGFTLARPKGFVRRGWTWFALTLLALAMLIDNVWANIATYEVHGALRVLGTTGLLWWALYMVAGLMTYKYMCASVVDYRRAKPAHRRRRGYWLNRLTPVLTCEEARPHQPAGLVLPHLEKP